MSGDGMVAVVRGLGDAGLAVTVIDGKRQYTLVPNRSEKNDIILSRVNMRDNSTDPMTTSCKSSAPPMAGQYVTTYQIEHCRVKSNTPPVQLTEFPPQRTTLCHGHGNFEVGGSGSGETHSSKKTNNFRGAMNWTDRESVCSPRTPYKMDAFATSLRKYSSLSPPDKSFEVTERHCNYSQEKYGSKSRNECFQQPICLSEYHTSNLRTSSRSRPKKQDVKMRTLSQSPSKKEKDVYGFEDLMFPNEYNMRFLKDISKRAREYAKIAHVNYATSVDTEIQAAVKMVSREVATVPRITPIRRTIAIPSSPVSSTEKFEGEFCGRPRSNSIIKIDSQVDCSKYVPMTSSCLEFDKLCVTSDSRRIKSQIELRSNDINFETVNSKNNIRDELISQIYQPISHEQIKTDKSVDTNFICEDSYLSDHLVNVRFSTGPNYSTNIPFTISEGDLYYIIKKWLSIIILRCTDEINNPLDRNIIIHTTANVILRRILNRTILDGTLKSEILNTIEVLPFKSFCNSKYFINNLVNILCDSLGHMIALASKERKSLYHSSDMKLYFLPRKEMMMDESDLRNIVSYILVDLLAESSLTIHEDLLQTLKNEIGNIVTSADRQCNSYTELKDEIRCIFKKCTQMTDEQATHVTDFFIDNLSAIFKEFNDHNMYTVLQGSINSTYTNSVSLVNKTDTDVNIDSYARFLSEQIEEWLNNLNVSTIKDTDFKRVVINEFASDIIDRYKYLQLKPSKRDSDSNELEHLKFQIYKWINKLVQDENNETLQHAEELWTKIKSLQIPMLINPETNIICSSEYCQNNKTKNNDPSSIIHSQNEGIERELNNLNTQEKEQCHLSDGKKYKSVTFNKNVGIRGNENESEKSGEFENTSHNKDNHTPLPKTEDEQPKVPYVEEIPNRSLSLKALNEDYDEYLKQWVQQIPISVTNSEEEKLAAVARLGILNGVWKAIMKIKLDPKIFNNPCYYEDVLDDEIEDLLGILPQTKELVANKHRLKAELLEKTMTMNEQMRAIIIPACYKLQLLENLNNHLPKISIFHPMREQTELLKISLIEYYILFNRYKNDDITKSIIYKNIFLKKVEDLADITTKYHKDKGVNSQVHVSELIKAITSVPTPDDQKITDEAKQILLGMEVSHWLSDLPLNANLDSVGKRRLRDKLVIKINEIESQKNLSDSCLQSELRKEIRSQLEKLALQGIDLNFITEELANRLYHHTLKNETNDNCVSSQAPDYSEFSKDMPLCSSFLDARGNINDGRSYMIIGGDIDNTSRLNNCQSFKEPTISEEKEWLSMGLANPASDIPNWSQSRTPVNSQKQIFEQQHTSIGNSQSIPRRVHAVTDYPRLSSHMPGEVQHKPFVDVPNFNGSKEENHNFNLRNYGHDTPYNQSKSLSPNLFQDLQRIPFSQEGHYGQSYGSQVRAKIVTSPGDYGRTNKPSLVSYNEQFPTEKPLHFIRSNAPSRNNPNIQRFIPVSETENPLHEYSVSPADFISPNNNNDIIRQTSTLHQAGEVGVDALRASQVTGSSGQRYLDDQEQYAKMTNMSHTPQFYNDTDKNHSIQILEQNNIPQHPQSKNAYTPHDNPSANVIGSTGYVNNGVNSSFKTEPFTSPTCTSGQPIAYSTPQQPIFLEHPDRPRKKYPQKRDTLRTTNSARRKLELEDFDSESNTEEEEFMCQCQKLCQRERRRFCSYCEHFYIDMPPCLSHRITHCPYFY